MRLLLFDIDGTLLTCGGQPKPLFAQALAEVFGTTGDIDGYDFSGRTDPGIVVDLMRGAGVEPDEISLGMSRVRDLYLDRLARELEPERVRIYPGVVELLETLARRDDCELALLTGNWERGAAIKLARAGLDRFFAFGSFGDDCTDRRLLPPRALERAALRHSRNFSPADTWIVGDSLLDVDCARAHGIPCLAVATGRTSRESLAAAGAVEVVADLTDRDAVIRRLLQ